MDIIEQKELAYHTNWKQQQDVVVVTWRIENVSFYFFCFIAKTRQIRNLLNVFNFANIFKLEWWTSVVAWLSSVAIHSITLASCVKEMHQILMHFLCYSDCIMDFVVLQLHKPLGLFTICWDPKSCFRCAPKGAGWVECLTYFLWKVDSNSILEITFKRRRIQNLFSRWC